ncbi:MAG: FAD-dependent oxidoreductase [Anaerolineae bacterium]|nr:FAD-dependent oxidoreductase [Anaerolineae bacterium]
MIDTDHNSFPIVIIGAGLAGLTAAAHLAERGIAPLVLEADQQWPGGRLSGGEPVTLEHQGCCWTFSDEHGIHAIWGGYSNLRATLERFTNTRLIPSPGEEWINRWRREVRVIEAGNAIRSRWIPAPFHYLQLLFHPGIWQTITPLDFLSLPGFLFSMLWTVGFDPLREQSALDGLTMDDYFHLWTPNLKATFVGLANNLLAAPSEEISLTALIAALRFYTIMRRDAWTMQYFPAPPHDCLLTPLIERIEQSGGQVLYGVTATRLERQSEGWRVVAEDARAQGLRSLHGDHIILAMQPPAAQRLLRISLDTHPEAASIVFPGAVRNATIRLWFDREPRPGTPGGMFTGDFLPDNFFWLHRLYDDFGTWSAETGGSAIEVHLYTGKNILEQPDNVLLIQTLDEVQRAFPELRGHLIHHTIRRNSLNHSRFRVPTRSSLWLETPWPGITACGDWIGYDTPSFWMERSVTTAIAAANRVLTAQGLEPFPLQNPPPAEPFARGLGAAVGAFRATIGRGVVATARRMRRS